MKGVGRVSAVKDDLVPPEAPSGSDRDEAADLSLRKLLEERAAKHHRDKCDERDTASVKPRTFRKRALCRRVCVVMNADNDTQTGGGTPMLRKLTILSTLSATIISLAVTSSASATRVIEPTRPGTAPIRHVHLLRVSKAAATSPLTGAALNPFSGLGPGAVNVG